MTLSVQENVAELQLMLETLRRFNPNVKLIVTLSPVPLHATFLRESYHVVEANMHSKAVLRAAAQEFVEKNEDVIIFPALNWFFSDREIPGVKISARQRSAVSRVMVS